MSEPLTCPTCGEPWSRHLRVKQLAATWQISPSSVKRLISLGDLEAVQLGRTWHICRPSVDRYVREHSNRAERASA